MAIGSVRIRVGEHRHGVDVSERPERRRYPPACLDRHITPSGSFCLGLHLRPIENWADATDWWSDLHHFLVLQAIAEVTGCWPSQHSLSHGKDAARLEMRARRLAAKLNVAREYDDTVEGVPTALATILNSAASRVGGKTGAMSTLARLEHARKDAVERIWESQHASGIKCCGSMKACRLRELEFAAEQAA